MIFLTNINMPANFKQLERRSTIRIMYESSKFFLKELSLRNLVF